MTRLSIAPPNRRLRAAAALILLGATLGAATLGPSPAYAQLNSIFGDSPPRPPGSVPNGSLPPQPPPVQRPAAQNPAPQPYPPGPAPSGIEAQPLPPPPGAVMAPAAPRPALPPQSQPPAQGARLPLPPGVPGASPAPSPTPSSPADASPPPDEGVVTEMPAQKIENSRAVFAGLDKITGRTISFDAAIGETVQFGALRVTARVCYTRPPTEATNTDAFVQVDEVTLQGEVKRIFSGWMFAESPGLHAVEHPIYDVWLTDCSAPIKVAEPAPAAPVPGTRTPGQPRTRQTAPSRQQAAPPGAIGATPRQP
jgi:hypothetical protein